MVSSSSSSTSNPNTTFVHADPSVFRAVVQRLTGNSYSPDAPPFKLRQRRPAATKLEIQVTNNHHHHLASPLARSPSARKTSYHKVMASPVSQREFAAACGSPTTPRSPEERAIAEKGFYLHPNPRGSDPPELLPLFPLQ